MNVDPAQDELLVEEPAPHVLQIRLNRPERLNALGVGMTHALLAALARVRTGEWRVLVIRGTGKAFCAGADLKERRTMAQDERRAHNVAINDAITAIEATPIPVIAAINGLALGGGCEIALACDVRVITEDASIGLTEARIGAIPGAGGTQRLPRLVGVACALEMMLTGEPVSGLRAEQIGLANRAVPADQFDDAVLQMAKLIALKSPTSSRLIKQLVREGMDLTLPLGLKRERSFIDQILNSKDYAEGLAAFQERRAPRFTGQ